MCNLFKRKKIGEIDLKCPRCSVAMKKIKKSNVLIDICPDCNGMWLDDNEIYKLIQISKRGMKNGKKKK